MQRIETVTPSMRSLPIIAELMGFLMAALLFWGAYTILNKIVPSKSSAIHKVSVENKITPSNNLPSQVRDYQRAVGELRKSVNLSTSLLLGSSVEL